MAAAPLPPWNASAFSTAFGKAITAPKPAAPPKPVTGYANWNTTGYTGAGAQPGPQGFKVQPGVGGTPTATPGAGAAGAPAAPAPPAPSGLDSTYYTNVANNLFKAQNSITADQQAETANNTALQTALGQLAYAQPRAQLALEQKANVGGGLYSSVYDQNLGNLNNTYLQKEGADTTAAGGKNAALEAKIAALFGSIPLYNTAQASDSAGRAAVLAAANPAAGQTPILPPAPAPAPAPAAKAPVKAAPKPPAKDTHLSGSNITKLVRKLGGGF